MNRYPAVADLRKRAHRRMPLVAREYMETGTDEDEALRRNREALQAIRFHPEFLKGSMRPRLETSLLDRTYAFPFGIAPVGLTGLMWPKAEVYFAQAARKYQIPFCLSTLATETPESLAPHLGEQGWFQLYTPREEEMAFQLLDRAKQSGFHTLVITVDIPMPSRRQRTKRAGLRIPPRLSLELLWQGMTHPIWSMATLRRGLPRLRTIEDIPGFNEMMSVGAFMSEQMGGNLSWEYVERLKAYWKGPCLLKGIMAPADVEEALKRGCDGIILSNHGARQFDGALSPLEVLPAARTLTEGKVPLLMDSGLRSGLDILRALALGADFVLLGRAFLYGVAALGKWGPEHVIRILSEEMVNNMMQLGIEDLKQLPDRLADAVER